jgi:hypothetical protein
MFNLFKKGSKKDSSCCNIQIEEVTKDCCSIEEKQACCVGTETTQDCCTTK